MVTITLPLDRDFLERQNIEAAMKLHGNNITRAAKEVGIGRATLLRRIDDYANQDRRVAIGGPFECLQRVQTSQNGKAKSAHP